MNSNEINELSFVSNLGDIKSRPDIASVEGGLGIRPFVPLMIPTPQAEDSLREALKTIDNFLESITTNESNGTFGLDEIEFTVQVSQSGKVSIWLADVGGSVSGGLKLKWKRRRSSQ